MTLVAGIRNLQRFGIAWRDEVESVTPNILIGDGLRDLRHVTGYAFAASATGLMMRVRLDRGRVWPGLGIRAVTVETQGIAGLADHANIVGAMRVVAAKARHAARIHQALHEVVALHAVLVRGAVGEVRKSRFAPSVRL